jgi:CRISPR-associated protein Cas2
MRRRRVVVAYDIRDDRRLRRVHLVCRSWGEPLQYSVFICDLTPVERVELLTDLAEEINQAVDSIVLIDLGEAEGRGTECFQFLGDVPYRLPTGGPRFI